VARKLRDPSDITLRVIAAGQGTTATHAIYAIICEAGLKACHHKQCCNVETGSSIRKANAKFIVLFQLIQTCLSNTETDLRKYCGLTEGLQGFQHDHGLPKACGKDRSMRECCKGVLWSGSPLLQEEAVELVGRVGCSVEKALAALDELLWELVTSGLEALTDTPTSSFVPSFAAAAPHHPFKIVLTTRAPKIWAQKRVAEHGNDYLCGLENGAGARLADFGGCMSQAVKQAAKDRPLVFSDAFVKFKDTTAAERAEDMKALQDTLIPSLAKEMAGRDLEDTEGRYGPWFMEIDFFEQTINRVASGEGDGSEMDEAEAQSRFVEKVEERFDAWLKEG